ncbi:polyprenyl synthetase family protein [Paracrocinitomix mangrovi]|uniref:polyprenyl synthetase family protein n=1 Tax=Paracrocinitomix mangrovi TaxID=2862509 RepID=UPI001EDA9DCD|nr:polyprenyl synthetase family protein [Paracrocinitomix mangrovi]UKN00891.1 polyprenyl synthetase family protein [Paracrocinitomix mangrovi]
MKSEDKKLNEMLSQIESYRSHITNEIAATQFPEAPLNLYEPVKYILDLGGKRMRPILSMMACEMFSGEYQKALNAAMGVEIFHNFTLIHDDIMDEAPLRRGKETVHKKWNERVGLLSGDALMIESYKRLSQYTPELLPRILKLYNITAIEVCEGQQMDMDFESREDVTIDEYIVMIRKKTAVLLGCSLQLGALVGGSSDKDAQDLYEFGTNLGIAFQLQDDILDVFADQSKFGKQVGGDIIANKKTYLLLKALETANSSQLSRLKTLFNETDLNKKVEGVKEIYAELDIQNKSIEKMELFYKTAMKNLDDVNVDESKKMPLRTLANFLLSRES